MIERRLILRGIIAGGIAGLLAAIFTRVMAEPWIQKSINYQDAHDTLYNKLAPSLHKALLPPGPDIFSRSTQRNLGAPVGLVVFGAAMGALFAVVFVLLNRRYGDRIRPRVLALGLSVATLFAIYLVPYTKYPANPPGIGHPNTIHARGNLYLGMVGVSIVSVTAAFFLVRYLSKRIGTWNAGIATVLVFILWMAIIESIFPALGHLHVNIVTYGNFDSETPQPLYNAAHKIVYPGFPADVLFRFRFYSILNQVILWGTIGLGFGFFAERVLSPAKQRSGSSLNAAVPAA